MIYISPRSRIPTAYKNQSCLRKFPPFSHSPILQLLFRMVGKLLLLVSIPFIYHSASTLRMNAWIWWTLGIIWNIRLPCTDFIFGVLDLVKRVIRWVSSAQVDSLQLCTDGVPTSANLTCSTGSYCDSTSSSYCSTTVCTDDPPAYYNCTSAVRVV